MKTIFTTRSNEHTGKHLMKRLPRSLSGRCGLADKRGSTIGLARQSLRSRHGISSIQYFNNGSLHCIEQKVWKAPFLVHAANEQSLALQKSDQLGIQDTWDVLKDLWSRLRAICTVTVTSLHDGYEIAFAQVQASDWDDESLALIEQAKLDACYRWHQDGRLGDFVQYQEYRGRDLVFGMTPLGQMARWTDGENIVSQVRGFLSWMGQLNANPLVHAGDSK